MAKAMRGHKPSLDIQVREEVIMDPWIASLIGKGMPSADCLFSKMGHQQKSVRTQQY